MTYNVFSGTLNPTQSIDRESKYKTSKKGKGKGFTYWTPSVGPGADPGVQAVSLQVTVKSSTLR